MEKIKKLFLEKGQDFMLYFLAILATSIGVYQGVKGYNLIMANDPAAAWGIMLMAGIGVLLMDLKLKQEKETANRRSQIVKILLAYSLLASITFFGNFNAFFTNSLKDRIVKEELNKMQKNLESITWETNNRLNQQNDTTALRSNVQQELDNLWAELQEQNNTGLGADAKKILQRLADILAVPAFQVPEKTVNYTKDQLGQLFKSYEDRANNQLEKALEKHRNSRVNQKNIAVNTETEKWLKEIASALNTQNDAEDDKQALIGSIAHFNSTLGLLRTLIQNPSFTEANDPLTELGKVYYTLEKARSGKYNNAVWFALIMSFVIDFIVPFIFLVVVNPQRTDPKEEFKRLTDELVIEQKKNIELKKKIDELRQQIDHVLNH